ncbi:DMSO reductase anchor subunit [Pedobacter africanus]|uniref:DMSO reductase anchor subunit n=1 Tax=Pedobacter africanus TaxID=151894 RepID=A0ACC6KX71_9SPHI|nr:hypothetical protein [Pedobacter africanus]MDR6783852.1 DMSO reductase anchor subunit [Pedobacter africanus]
MNLDELKTAWQEYDNRLTATEEINQKVIASMIGERSVSRVARIRRRYMEMLCLFLFYTVCLTGFFFGNPFDYTFPVQYIPLAAIVLCCILMVIFLFRARMALKKIELERQNLEGALVQVIAAYAKYRKSFRYIIILLFCSSMLLNLSRIIAKIPESGILEAVYSFLIFAALMGFAWFYAGKKTNGWPDLGKEEKGLYADLEELKELNAQ